MDARIFVDPNRVRTTLISWPWPSSRGARYDAFSAPTTTHDEWRRAAGADRCVITSPPGTRDERVGWARWSLGTFRLRPAAIASPVDDMTRSCRARSRDGCRRRAHRLRHPFPAAERFEAWRSSSNLTGLGDPLGGTSARGRTTGSTTARLPKPRQQPGRRYHRSAGNRTRVSPPGSPTTFTWARQCQLTGARRLSRGRP